jgi:1,4-alpha-glucan branching enzyme
MAKGQLAIVLHAHLPYVRHPEYRYHLEENWLFEAVTATYLPLLEVYRGLLRDGVGFRFTMSLSPPLVSMLRDDHLRHRTAAYMDRLLRLGDEELRRTQGDERRHKLARYYADRFGRLKALYDEIQGDLVQAFRQLQDDGFLEIVTVGATHGYLPVIREEAARRAQIRVAVESYRHHFGRWPRGIWLPECGYTEGVDRLLADEGIRYFFTDAHGVLLARPRPPFGTAAPVYLRSGVAAFGRDIESSKQVWSADEGYPGDAAYRDFYRDIGFDLPLDVIGPYVHPDGIRVHTGFKYHRVTGRVDLAQKDLYDPDVARERAAEHAGNFLFNREQQIKHLAGQMDRPPIVVSPYDAELYGHWWFEGPMFLDFLARKTFHDQSTVELGTPAEYLEHNSVQAVAEVAPSSWGDGGYSAVWVDPSNHWIYRHVQRAERRMVELANAHREGADGWTRRALNQAARELLLLQSSDWAFIMKTGTSTGYAVARVKAHIARFRRLDRELSSGGIDQGWLADLERRDNIFPDLDYHAYVG